MEIIQIILEYLNGDSLFQIKDILCFLNCFYMQIKSSLTHNQE